jgi:hypothetical protein
MNAVGTTKQLFLNAPLNGTAYYTLQSVDEGHHRSNSRNSSRSDYVVLSLYG